MYSFMNSFLKIKIIRKKQGQVKYKVIQKR